MWRISNELLDFDLSLFEKRSCKLVALGVNSKKLLLTSEKKSVDDIELLEIKKKTCKASYERSKILTRNTFRAHQVTY